FLVLVADTVFRREGKPDPGAAFQNQSFRVAWAGLAITVISGAAWLVVQTVTMSGQPLGEALAEGVLWIILSKTQVGTVSVIRFALAVLLAISLALTDRRRGAKLVSASFAAR